MKVIVIFVAILGVALSAEQDGLKFPPPKRMFVEPNKPIAGLPGPRVLNGSEVTPHSIPYQVYLEVNSLFGSWSCGGSLISQKYVLTAAHCLDGGDDGIVLLGAHNITRNETSQKIVRVNKFTVHEDYDASAISNDIGLIELPYAVNLSKAINVSLLPTRKEANNSFADEIARVSGWGLTNGFGYEGSPVLLATESPVLTNVECKSWYPNNVRDNQVCISGNNGKGSCNGDSGGPLVELKHKKQIGIVSYGIAYCRRGYPSAFTRVGDFLDWIEKHSDLEIL